MCCTQFSLLILCFLAVINGISLVDAGTFSNSHSSPTKLHQVFQSSKQQCNADKQCLTIPNEDSVCNLDIFCHQHRCLTLYDSLSAYLVENSLDDKSKPQQHHRQLHTCTYENSKTNETPGCFTNGDCHEMIPDRFSFCYHPTITDRGHSYTPRLGFCYFQVK